jgi:LPS-assembly protein
MAERMRRIPTNASPARLAFCASLLAAALVLTAAPARAQPVPNPVAGAAGGVKMQPDQPVSFVADKVEYDQAHGIVTATGHVQAWQNGHVLMADKVVYDRNTNVAAATGDVVLLSPDGQVLFSHYAELGEGMRNGVLAGMSARLPQNARLMANGARRTEGKINEFSHVVYSTCDLCSKDPRNPPLWEIRAQKAVQDVEHKKIEYQDAELLMYGVPVAYFPYVWHVDPSVKRASGLLIPIMGNSSAIGAFFAQPYYWVLDDQSDATITPMITTRSGPQVNLNYRRRFNFGEISADSSLGEINGKAQGHIFASGRFSLDDTWRYGFNLNRASSTDYLRDFHIAGDADVLTSQAFLEGFGQGSYARVDSRWYQGLTSSISNSELPVVLPRAQYSYFGPVDQFGGRLSLDAGGFNVARTVGTNTQRTNLAVNWARPFTGQLGDLWTFTLHGDAAAYNATNLNEQPNYSDTNSSATEVRLMPQAALKVRWPLMRDSGAWGTQIVEPIAQVIVAPGSQNHLNTRTPNEDSLDQDFTDANLFDLNRFPGIDRMEGGVRAAVALHLAWYLNGTVLDGQIGQSYRTHPDDAFLEQSGLRDTVSDVVGHISYSPAPWLDLVYRTRLDHKTFNVRMADALASVGNDRLRINGGYIYTSYNPYALYDTATPTAADLTPRNEITLGATGKINRFWKVSGYVRRDLQTKQMVSTGARVTYEDECFIFDAIFNRRFTSVNNDNGATQILFQLTFKTVGQFGYRAL